MTDKKDYIKKDNTVHYYSSVTSSYVQANVKPVRTDFFQFQTEFLVGTASKQTPLHAFDLNPSNERTYNYFGAQLDISGSTMAVAAKTTSIVSDGTVFVYEKDGTIWYERARLTSSINGNNSTYVMTFGGDDENIAYGNDQSISIHDGKILIGSSRERNPPNTSPRGAVFLFTSQSNGQYACQPLFNSQLITASNTIPRYGAAVLAHDNFFAVSAPDAKTLEPTLGGMNSGNAIGLVYIYSYNVTGSAITDGKHWVQYLTGPLAPNAGYNFGSSIGYDEKNNFLNIGWSGGVEVFQSSSAAGWHHKQTISKPAGLVSDTSALFGESMDVASDYMIVGAYGDEHTSTARSYEGTAVIYKYDSASGTYGVDKVLSGSGGEDFETFGQQVSISLSGSDVYAVVCSNKDKGDFLDGEVQIWVSKSLPDTEVWKLYNTLSSSENSRTGNYQFGSYARLHSGSLAVGSAGAQGAYVTGSSAFLYGKAHTHEVSASVVFQTEIVGVAPPRKFGSKGPFNIRGQTATKKSQTFLGEQKT